MIATLRLQDVRSHADSTYDLGRQVVFVGENGRGKTNILEALCVLSTGKSWRTSTQSELLRHGQESAKIEAILEDDRPITLLLEARKRTVWHYEKPIPLTKHLGTVPSLLFAPEHLTLFSGGKRERLRFFDRFLCQISPTYAGNLIQVNRAVKNKNALLRQEDIPVAEIEPWNRILAAAAPEVTAFRRAFCAQITPRLQSQWESFTRTSEPIKVELTQPDVTPVTHEEYAGYLQALLPRERAAGRSLVGPHREDFDFALREKPLTATASRGEVRSSLLALLAAQKEYLADQGLPAPMLLLDDVFSELDSHRQSRIEGLTHDTQVICTTTHASHTQQFLQMPKIIEV